MKQFLSFVGVAAVVLCLGVRPADAAGITGYYIETRTCQIYTGPCFANAETALTGKDAIMAWNIESGRQNGVTLDGLNVVMVLTSSHTLADGGIADAQQVKSIIYVDDRANEAQRSALVELAKAKSGKAGQAVVRVESVPIQLALDGASLTGELRAGKSVKLKARAARPGDCICTNEMAYYPPLTPVQHFAPGVAIEGEFRGRGLGTHWSIPGSRSVYMATFIY